jgi:hypothetical protein
MRVTLQVIYDLLPVCCKNISIRAMKALVDLLFKVSISDN